MADQEVAWALLAGLPQAYETVVTVLETSSTEDVKLDDILPKLMSVEQRMYITKSPGPSEAALAAAAKRQEWLWRSAWPAYGATHLLCLWTGGAYCQILPQPASAAPDW